MSQIVFSQGRFVSPAEATVSLSDRGYLLGDGIFATLRAHEGTCFRPEQHLDIFARGAALLELPIPFALRRIIALADETARRVGESEVNVRLTLTRGLRDDGDEGAPTFSILGRRLDVPSPVAYARGVDTIVASQRRIPPSCMDGTIKTTSYAAAIVAQREARRRGATEALQLCVDGTLSCGAMANLFVVAGDRLLTPHLGTGCRAGITRRAVLELATRANLHPEEVSLAPSDLQEADEAFLTNTRVGCLPIATVDGRSIGARGGRPARFTYSARLHALLEELVVAETTGRRSERP